MIGYGKQYIDDDDIKAVVDVLKGESLTGGPIIDQFEDELKKYTGFKNCSVVNSGTAALHCALFAAGIKSGDEVIVPSITFAATANAVCYMRAKPVFCDVGEDLLINPYLAENLINEKTRAVISVDMGGQLVDYRFIRNICDKHNLIFISDSCHALGAIKKNSKINRPDLICYSFHPVKHITTGEGGAVLTDNLFYDTLIKAFRNHGRYKVFDNMQLHIGYNYRMAEINAALGISQLKKIDKFIAARKIIAKKYIQAFKNMVNVKLIKQSNENVYHLFILKVNNREQFIKYMHDEGISCIVHYPPVYDHSYHNRGNVNCPYTASIYDQIVSIPMFYKLSEGEQNYIISKIIHWENSMNSIIKEMGI
jgi:perosamine synthetase